MQEHEILKKADDAGTPNLAKHVPRKKVLDSWGCKWKTSKTPRLDLVWPVT